MSTATPTRRHRRIGVTLIELAFVIAIIAILVVAALAVYRAVSQTLSINSAIRDVATIRQAMKNFAGDDQICCGDDTANLTQWFQIRGFLSGAIRDEAIRNGSSATLSGVNPWQGDYSFTVDEDLPYQFQLQITEVDAEMLDTLSRKLADGAEDEVDVSEGDDSGQITVVYPL